MSTGSSGRGTTTGTGGSTGGHSSDEMVSNVSGITVIRDHLTVVGLQSSQYLETAQAYLASVINTANDKALILYANTVRWFDESQVHHRLVLSYDLLVSKGNEILFAWRNGFHDHLYPVLTHLRAFFGNDVCKQAIYFGFAGLLTGGMIGLCIGYSSAKQTTFSSQYFPSPGNSPPPSLMKAIFCSSSRRGIDGITLSSIPVPRSIGSTEVLVQVKAMGLDNIDARVACGYGHLLRSHMSLRSIHEPFILGRECTGLVLEIGSDVKSCSVNDRVWVTVPIWASPGLMSEYTVVSEKYVGLMPRNITYEGAATLPYAAVVVWNRILSKADLHLHNAKNKRILVHLGPTSKNDGVGLLLTQVLKSWGVRVTISTVEPGYRKGGMDHGHGEGDELSGEVAQMTFLHTLKSLGAETHLILPTDEGLLRDLAQRIFDVVVNTDSSTVTPLLANFLKDPNDSVIDTYPPHLRRRSCWNLFYIIEAAINYFFKHEGDESCQSALAECGRLIDSGFLVPVVSRSFLASQYDQAFRHVSNTSTSALAHVGKCVLVFKPLSSPL